LLKLPQYLVLLPVKKKKPALKKGTFYGGKGTFYGGKGTFYGGKGTFYVGTKYNLWTFL